MTGPRLRLVTPGAGGSSLSARIASLQAQARDTAREHVDQLVAALEQVALLSAEIVEAGDALHAPGVVQACRQLADQAPMASQHLRAIQQRIKS